MTAQDKLPTRVVLCLLLTAVSVVFLGIRLMLTTETFYWFLPWNLMLAWVPLIFSMSIIQRRGIIQSRFWQKGILGFFWLIFFPNAPYIVTDYIHVVPRAGVPVIFDFLMMTAFAVAGLFLAYVSLDQIHMYVQKLWGRTVGWVVVWVVMILSSVGIYLGRFLRWNSWDIFFHPTAVFSDILLLFHRVLYPVGILVTLGFAVGLFLFYACLQWVHKKAAFVDGV